MPKWLVTLTLKDGAFIQQPVEQDTEEAALASVMLQRNAEEEYVTYSRVELLTLRKGGEA